MNYKHWLNLKDSPNYKNDLKRLLKYLEKYPDATTVFYYKENSLYNSMVICLECGQCYNDLDLDVNSRSSNFYRYTRKPTGIALSKLQMEDWTQKIEK